MIFNKDCLTIYYTKKMNKMKLIINNNFIRIFKIYN